MAGLSAMATADDGVAFGAPTPRPGIPGAEGWAEAPPAWQRRQTSYSRTGETSAAGTGVRSGAAPAGPLAILTRATPSSRPLAAPAVTSGSWRARCGLWQSVQAVWSAAPWAAAPGRLPCRCTLRSSVATSGPGPVAPWQARQRASPRASSMRGMGPAASRLPCTSWQLTQRPASPRWRALGLGPGQTTCAEVAWVERW